MLLSMLYDTYAVAAVSTTFFIINQFITNNMAARKAAFLWARGPPV